jgi:hypothetical protein
MSRDYAWSCRGKRAYSTGKGKRISVIGAVSLRKMFYEGGMNNKLFYYYVENYLCKHLNKIYLTICLFIKTKKHSILSEQQEYRYFFCLHIDQN